MSLVLRVALPLPLPQLFDYLPPASGIGAYPSRWIGCRVEAPFGRRSLIGVVAEVGPAQSDPRRLRALRRRIDADALLSGELWATLQFAARYYVHPLGETIATALPQSLRSGELPRLAGERWYARSEPSTPPRGALALRIYDELAGGPRARLDLLQLGPSAASVLARLVERRLLQEIVAPERKPRPTLAPPPLNADQQSAIAAVAQVFGSFQPFVLDGVTGSGKTEVYLALIAAALAAGKQALVLVPEIGLTPQTLRRFRERLGVEIHALHSGLAEGERAGVWLAAHSGRARVVVGTRSAIFTPLPSAGLIIVDEEHDASYKQQDGLRYHARDLALVRARALNVPIVLGSATPALETVANVQSGRYTRLALPERAGFARPPQWHIEDLRRIRLVEGLSPRLLDAIGERLARQEHVLVFRNRRGYAPTFICHSCGHVASCPRCDVALTVHRDTRELRCHHCGRIEVLYDACSKCAAPDPVARGVGTERLTELLTERFPNVPVIRIDRDTTRRRGSVDRLLQELPAEQAAVLVGTQMLAKGHDLPQLTLAAIVNVDAGLFSADFRAPERLAQLLVQVAGRAGRARKPGLVWLETHHPEHPLLRAALDDGYAACAAAELGERRALALPPFAHWALLRAEATAEAQAVAFLEAARAQLNAPDSVLVRGPLPAPMPRRAGRHRAQLLLECAERAPLRRVLDVWAPLLHGLPEARKARWSLDVDPIDLS